MRKVGLILGAVVLLAIALGPAFAAAAQPFSDVPRDHWAYNAIERLSQQGVLEGYPDGTFKGKRTMTRYEFAVAIARIMDRIEGQATTTGGGGGTIGPVGPQGPTGPAGPGITPEQQALLDRLSSEFMPELRSLRSDLDNLKVRVEELEANKVKPPVVTVGGNIAWRSGAYGTKLSLKEGERESTGYPAIGLNGSFNTLFGVIPIVDPVTGASMGVIPISDALKDSFKANDFMSMRSHIDLTANIGGGSSAFVSILASPNTNIMDRLVFDGSSVSGSVSPSSLSGNGILDLAQLDQAYFHTGTKFITPVELTIGKQYLRRGQGLLFDNDQEALKGVRADFGGGNFRVGTFLAMLDPEAFFGRTAPIPFGLDVFGNVIGTYEPPADSSLYARQMSMYGASGQDQYRLFYADLELIPGWRIGGNWLDSGFARERGWSASLSGGLFGLDLYGEYSRLTRWPNGLKFADFDSDGSQDFGEVNLSESNTAWLAGLRWNSKWVNLTGEYGQVDAGYAFSGTGTGGWDALANGGFFNLPLSALHPRAEIDPYDINWVDRRLFLDPTNIARGWHVGLNLPSVLGGKSPISFSYAGGDSYNPAYLGWLSNGGENQAVAVARPDKWRDADPVWWVKVSHQMSDAVTASLLYGRREVDNVLSTGAAPVGTVPATTDAIQVLRAEVSVQF